MFTNAFEEAVNHAMLYEVGSHWNLTPEVAAGIIDTPRQRRNVGYVNDPLDAGGETKYGIAKNGNPDIDITNLDWETAKEIYYDRYWQAGSCDKLPPRVAVLHFDGCINHGIERANKFLQEAVGVYVDGNIGPKTLNSVNQQDEIETCIAICDRRAEFYQEIVSRKPNQSRFLRGWLRRITEMRNFTTRQEMDFS